MGHCFLLEKVQRGWYRHWSHCVTGFKGFRRGGIAAKRRYLPLGLKGRRPFLYNLPPQAAITLSRAAAHLPPMNPLNQPAFSGPNPLNPHAEGVSSPPFLPRFV